jgi:7-carboxy-7-deazaguanine synthase
LLIHSHFISIDGEVNKWGQGVPSVFLRLQNCNLRCSYCDIPEAQDPKGGRVVSVDEVVEIIRRYECPKITITGGEPLLQDDSIHELLNRLFPENYRVSIETNGTLSTRRFRECRKPNENVCLVVDYKFDHYNPDAFEFLRDWDWVKIVIGNREEFDKAREVLSILRELGCKARFALSPIHETLSGKMLAEWILDSKMWDVTLNCQIHKWLNLA